jgi:uncharacterized protein (DUF58 family)
MNTGKVIVVLIGIALFALAYNQGGVFRLLVLAFLGLAVLNMLVAPSGPNEQSGIPGITQIQKQFSKAWGL